MPGCTLRLKLTRTLTIICFCVGFLHVARPACYSYRPVGHGPGNTIGSQKSGPESSSTDLFGVLLFLSLSHCHPLLYPHFHEAHTPQVKWGASRLTRTRTGRGHDGPVKPG
ncbi:hypothetical protein DER45DRAFT_232954 [Fusarium avenaceum]|nr:hypothetical protein DER45DRAFT_232954 [Fusarium avenaceum]